MSAKKYVGSGPFEHPLTVEARQARLELSAAAVTIRKSGIEFRSPTPFSPWTEMTVALKSPRGGTLRCHGVVIACAGNKHTGYLISMVFTGLTKQGQAQLHALASTQPPLP